MWASEKKASLLFYRGVGPKEFNNPKSYLNKLPGDVQDLIKTKVEREEKREAASELQKKLIDDFLDHVKTHDIDKMKEDQRLKGQRYCKVTGRKLPPIDFDRVFEQYKRNPSKATSTSVDIKSGFMGKWFKKLATLPSECFSKRDGFSLSRDISNMVEAYLEKFIDIGEQGQNFLLHDADVDDIATSLMEILTKSGYSEIPSGVLEEILNREDKFPEFPQNSFWNDAKRYWSDLHRV